MELPGFQEDTRITHDALWIPGYGMRLELTNSGIQTPHRALKIERSVGRPLRVKAADSPEIADPNSNCHRRVAHNARHGFFRTSWQSGCSDGFVFYGFFNRNQNGFGIASYV